MANCFDSTEAEALLRGRLPEARYTAAVQHAAKCTACRRLLFDVSRPELDQDLSAIHDIQERLRGWCVARRAPLFLGTVLHKGDVVGSYVVVRQVGDTEHGCVYEAIDPDVEQRVVLKQLDLESGDPAAAQLRRLLGELRHVAHPNVLEVLAIGDHGGHVYVVHPLVKGQALSQDTPLEPRVLIDHYVQAGRGLAAVHAQKLAHGCFGPASCVVGRDGRVRVLDFGVAEALARRHEPDDEPVPAHKIDTDFARAEDSFIGYMPQIRKRWTTDPGDDLVLSAVPSALGMRLYSAPEQLRGAEPSPRADQFAFCAALFQRLYGRLPFAGDTIAAWLRSVLKGRIVVPDAHPEIPDHLLPALRKGLSIDPAMRFADMRELVAELDRRRWSPRARALVAGGAVVAAGLGLAAVLVAPGAEPGAPSTSCQAQVAAPWDGAWTAPKAEALGKTFTGRAAEAWPLLRARIDQRVTSWRGAGATLCGIESSTRDQCITRARDAVADLVQLVAAREDGAALSPGAADALPVVDDCAAPAATARLRARWPGTAIAAEARRGLGRFDEAERIAKVAAVPATELVRGLVAVDRGDLGDARQLLEGAVFAAQGAGDAGVALEAAVHRLELTCSVPERALWRGFAEAQAKLAGTADALRPQLDAAVAASLACEGRDADALVLRDRLAHLQPGSVTVATADAELAFAHALIARGDAARAHTAAARARAIYHDAYGSSHPTTLNAALADVEAAVLDHDLTTADQRLQLVQATVAGAGSDADADLGPVRVRAMVLASRLQRAHGKLDDAVKTAVEASQVGDAVLGGTHPVLAAALLEAGDRLLEADRDAEAEAAFRQAVAILEMLGHVDSDRMLRARAGAALAALARPGKPGTSTAAVAPAADALDALRFRLASHGELEPAVDGWLAEHLARRAMRAGDRTHARTLYAAATAAWQASGDTRRHASAAARGALLAGDRAQLERALELVQQVAVPERPRVQAALAKLLWSSRKDRDRAKTLATAAAAELSGSEAAELKTWLKQR